MADIIETLSVRKRKFVGLRVDVQNSELEYRRKIAESTSSVVYEGVYQGKAVAIKRPILRNSSEMDRYHMELEILASLQHPNLVTLAAARAWPPDYSFIVPFMRNGSLGDLVHVSKWKPSWGAVLNHATEIAEGLGYLNSMGYVHRDIKPMNILLDDSWVARISDFGICEREEDLRQSIQAGIYCTEDAEGKATEAKWIENKSGKPSGGFQRQHMVGTMHYLAPEILMRQVATPKTDIYAFAITLCELATGVVPYSDRARNVALAHTILDMSYNDEDLRGAIVADDLRPVLPDDKACPAGLTELLQVCWSKDPDMRLDWNTIIGMLKVMKTQLVASKGDEASLTVWTKPAYSAGDSACNGSSEQYIAPALCDCLPAWESGQSLVNGTASYPVVSAGVFSTFGARGPDKMEDRHILHPKFHELFQSELPPAHFFCVFDGHRGAEASEFCANHMIHALTSSWSTAADPSNALEVAFCEVDAQFVKETGGISKDGRRHPGATAISVLVWRNQIVVANAGDCRCLLSRGGKPMPLSVDHTADLERERNRVVADGGSIKLYGNTWRIGSAGMQVTRAIGDLDMKSQGVTALPEVMVHCFDPQVDEFLVLACDGLWDVCSNEDVIELVKTTVKEPSMAAKRLGIEAMNRGSGDNITAIVVFLNHVSTVERVY